MISVRNWTPRSYDRCSRARKCIPPAGTVASGMCVAPHRASRSCVPVYVCRSYYLCITSPRSSSVLPRVFRIRAPAASGRNAAPPGLGCSRINLCDGIGGPDSSGSLGRTIPFVRSDLLHIVLGGPDISEGTSEPLLRTPVYCIALFQMARLCSKVCCQNTAVPAPPRKVGMASQPTVDRNTIPTYG